MVGNPGSEAGEHRGKFTILSHYYCTLRESWHRTFHVRHASQYYMTLALHPTVEYSAHGEMHNLPQAFDTVGLKKFTKKCMEKELNRMKSYKIIEYRTIGTPKQLHLSFSKRLVQELEYFAHV